MPDFSKVWASNSPLPAYTFSDADYLTGWDFVGSAPPTKNEFDAWFRMVDEKLNYLYGQLQNTASKVYPVGSVYISFNSTDPSTLFGGTWARLKDRMLMASGDAYAPNTTGGSATKTIAVSNLPAHNHTVNAGGTHNHTASTGSSGVHNHTASTGAGGIHDHTASTGAGGIHSHTASTGGAGGHTHTASSSSAGSHTHTINSAGNHYHGAMGEKNTYPSLYGFYNNSNSHQGANGDTDNAIWKTSTDGAHTHTMESAGSHKHDITVNSVSNHTHTVTVANSTSHTHTVTVANSTSHTHTVTVNNSTSHTHTVTVNNNGSHTHTTNNTGGGTPLNILPPYTTVYMWRRTA